MKRIVLTGGGSAGHVTPHFALLPHLQQDGWEVHYIGTYSGIERQLVGKQLPYHPISSGKLRRYFDLQNFTDPFRVLKGVFQARKILKKLRPQVVFSKGGFVSVPVTAAAWSLKIPVILHESDLTPGLANKISLPFARRLCLTFPETAASMKKKGIVTGTPIRAELLAGSPEKGRALCQFAAPLPVLLIIGGSLGSALLNEVIRADLKGLTRRYQVIHLCGQGNLAQNSKNPRYCQLEYAREELPDLIAAADFVVSRAGANSLFELLALRKPHILVPLSKQASRGDQIQNAQSFAAQGFSLVIPEEELNPTVLQETLLTLEADQKRFVRAMEASAMGDGTGNVLRIISEFAL